MAFSIVSVCANCHTKNRIPAQHLAESGRCGACKASLPTAKRAGRGRRSLF